jgi:hypothetical protein
MKYVRGHQMDNGKDSLFWKITIAIGFILAQAVILYTFYETQKTTKNIEIIRLARAPYIKKDLITTVGGKVYHSTIGDLPSFTHQ